MSAAVRLVALLLVAQEPAPLRLVESNAPGRQYHVSCRVVIDGMLSIPADKGQAARTIKVAGKSKVEYDERILKANERTIRHYDSLDFDRTFDGEEQHSSLRREVSRLVVLRHKQYEVPFSPSGPLTWGEIELVRTDVFTPALKGLLPTQPVRVGDAWPAEPEAVQELTDLEEITSGGLRCKLESVGTIVGRRQARISFQGDVRGIGEDGPASHQLDGTLYFDLEANTLSYVSLRGTRTLPGPNGQAGGKIEGSFTLTRTPLPSSPALSDAALRGLVLEPNDENTQLLFDSPALGVRFLYPRGWRVAGTNPRTLGLDHRGGSGLMLAMDPGPPQPNAVQQFHQAAQKGLAQQKARISRVGQPQQLQPGMTTFTIDAEIAQRPVTMQYYVLQQPAGTVTLTATLLPKEMPGVGREVERIAQSVQIGAPK